MTSGWLFLGITKFNWIFEKSRKFAFFLSCFSIYIALDYSIVVVDVVVNDVVVAVVVAYLHILDIANIFVVVRMNHCLFYLLNKMNYKFMYYTIKYYHSSVLVSSVYLHYARREIQHGSFSGIITLRNFPIYRYLLKEKYCLTDQYTTSFSQTPFAIIKSPSEWEKHMKLVFVFAAQLVESSRVPHMGNLCGLDMITWCNL